MVLKLGFMSPEKCVHYAASHACAPLAAKEEIADAEAEFRSKQGIKKYIRGKYLLWFFIQCAIEIHKAAPTLCRTRKVPKAHIGLVLWNIIFAD